jgi:tRNA(adenine34) deaminase
VADVPDDASYMRVALALATEAASQSEVPVGAIVVHKFEIIGRGFNQPISRSDPSAHAEIAALRAAGRRMRNYRLPDAALFVTLEPCLMCLGAIFQARVGRLVFGAMDPKAGACGGVIDLSAEQMLNHHTQVTGGVLAEPCADLLRQFFRARR